jgi:hypothetical protein
MRLGSPQSIIVWVMAIGMVVIALIVILVVTVFGLETMNTGQQQLKSWFAAWRGLLFISLIGGWPYWVKLLSARYRLTTSKTTELLEYRWRFACVLLVLEGLLNQDLLLKAVHLINGV